jgi:hypothetical protein
LHPLHSCSRRVVGNDNDDDVTYAIQYNTKQF